jgi:hypothetical protein
MNYSEYLALDSDRLEGVAAMYTGYGMAQRAHLESSRGADLPMIQIQGTDKNREALDEQQFLAASSLVIGGSYYSVLDPRLGALVFWAAAQTYVGLGMSYAGVLGICARDERLVSNEFDRVNAMEDVLIGDDALFQALIVTDLATLNPQEYAAQARRALEKTELSASRSRRGLPLRLFLNTLEQAQYMGDKATGPTRATGIVQLLSRFAEQVETAQGNRYAWSQILTGCLPVEPEILAATIIALRGSSGRDLSEFSRSRTNQIGPVVRFLLGVASEVVAIRDWKEGDRGSNQLFERRPFLRRISDWRSENLH